MADLEKGLPPPPPPGYDAAEPNDASTSQPHSQPQQQFQQIEWETPPAPPAPVETKKRASLFERLDRRLKETSWHWPRAEDTAPGIMYIRRKSDYNMCAIRSDSTLRIPLPNPDDPTQAVPPAPLPEPEPPKHPSIFTAAGIRSRFDSFMPPGGRYPPFGLTRRAFLLCVVLPLAVLLFLVLPLGVGLGVGLRRSRHAAASDTSTEIPRIPEIGESVTGNLTHFVPGLGACGQVNTEFDAVVALSHIIFDQATVDGNPNTNPLCGRKVEITRDFKERGLGMVTVTATIADRCQFCGAYDLDMSRGIFSQLAVVQSLEPVSGTWKLVS